MIKLKKNKKLTRREKDFVEGKKMKKKTEFEKEGKPMSK